VYRPLSGLAISASDSEKEMCESLLHPHASILADARINRSLFMYVLSNYSLESPTESDECLPE
jgi:hypothetical protein